MSHRIYSFSGQILPPFGKTFGTRSVLRKTLRFNVLGSRFRVEENTAEFENL
jgi:hypothetical protein